MVLNADATILEERPTGMPGFDQISKGGLPVGRPALVTGTAGSAETVFSVQFLAAGIEKSVKHNVVVLRNVSDDEKRRRTIEMLEVCGPWWRVWKLQGGWRRCESWAASMPRDTSSHRRST